MLPNSEQMDKDNPDSFIPGSSTGHVLSSDGPVVRHVLEAPGAAASGAAPPTSGSPLGSVQRRPGRPKGSSKKDLLGGPPPLPKIKRPVGRPRKDGLPAGSVGPKRAKVKRNPHTWVAHQGVEYPPVNMFVPGGSLSSHTMTFHTDPNMEMDDWAELARDKPDILLVILLTALAAPNAAASVGPTVEEAFRSHLASLAINSQQLQSIPSLYSVLKTFWLPSSPAYFSLTASTSTVRTPSEHRFLYWDPHPLVFNGISCPVCSQSLTNQGRITSGPVQIYDIEKPFFIIGCEYVCKSSQCTATAGLDGRKFASTDASIFRSLPSKLRDEFPARLMHGDTDVGSNPNIWNWKVAGVSSLLWNMVRASLKSGLKKEVILHLIYSIQRSVSDDGPRSSSGAPARTTTTDDGMDNWEAEGAKYDVQPGDDEKAASGTENHSFGDAYNTAWKENITARESEPSQVPAVVVPPPVQQHPYSSPQHPSFVSYAFYPQPFMNAAGMHSPSAGSISLPSNAQFSPMENGGSDTPQNKRSPRHCCKCGSKECKGKGGYTFCENTCQDCGKLECRGRNSRRPDERCSEGWV